MNMLNINPGAPPKVEFPLPRASVDVPKTKEAQRPKEAPVVEKVNLPAAEDAREDFVRHAAESYKTLFPIRDMRFTIFKDSSGQYITRFTNLVDGSVTHIPEPELIKTYNHLNGSAPPTFMTDV